MIRLFAAAILIQIATMTAAAQSLQLKWTSDTLLRVPESVYYDAKSEVLYVSNINGKSNEKDGNGFISQLSKDGKIIKLHWAKGLDAPKGMGAWKGLLYVADVTKVVAIDFQSGNISKTYEIEGAQFLNDITVDSNGDVYVSDSATGKIHVIKNDKAELYFESKDFKRVNGLFAEGDGLYIADAGTGVNYRLSRNKVLTKYTETAQGADGIVAIGSGAYIVSSWGGEIYFVDENAKSTKLLDTKEKKLNSADIALNQKEQMLYVPTFFGNSVMAYYVEGMKKQKQAGAKKEAAKKKSKKTK